MPTGVKPMTPEDEGLSALLAYFSCIDTNPKRIYAHAFTHTTVD